MSQGINIRGNTRRLLHRLQRLKSYFLSKEVLRELRGTPVWDDMRSVVGRYSARYDAEHPDELLMIRTPAEFRDFYNLQLGIERG